MSLFDLKTVLAGGTPAHTPYTVYGSMIKDRRNPDWQQLFERGLLIIDHDHDMICCREEGVTWSEERSGSPGAERVVQRKTTPIGVIEQVYECGRKVRHWLANPDDYRVMAWIMRHTTVELHAELWEKASFDLGNKGLVIPVGYHTITKTAEGDEHRRDEATRSPLQKINVDWAGTEQFCMDVGSELPELFDLYNAGVDFFTRLNNAFAACPAPYIKYLENLTISMIGTRRYEELLLPVYDKAADVLDPAGKKLMVHFDGELQAIAPAISRGRFHIIESLTEPPEGNMLYDECRAAWPGKVLWGNLNLGCYSLLPDELRAEVRGRLERAGRQGFALEISEYLPDNWRLSLPIVLDEVEK